MKKSDLLKQQRATLQGEIKPLAEKQELTTEERSLFDTKTAEHDQLEKDIAFEEKREQMLVNMAGPAGNSLSKNEERQVGGYSFAKVVRAAVNREGLEGFEKEMHQEAGRERQAIGGTSTSLQGLGIPLVVLSRAHAGQNISNAAEGGNLVNSEPVMYFEELQNKLVLAGLGAQLLTGVVGDLELVRGGSFTSSWGTEGSEVTNGKLSMPKASISPKQLMAAGGFSRMTFAQSDGVIEQLVRTELLNAQAQGIQSGVFHGATSGPLGLFNDPDVNSLVLGTNGGTLDWSKIIELETLISDANADQGNLSFVTNSKVRGALKQKLVAAGEGAGFIWTPGNEVGGYKAALTNGISSTLTKGTATKCSAAVLGDFSKLLLPTWGGLDIVYDPYSKKKSAEIELVVWQLANAVTTHPKAFAVCKDIVTG